jgi:hypothetical protein
MANLQNETIACSQVRQFAGMRGVVGNRLLDKHMFAALKERPRDLVMRVRRRRHRSGVNHLNKLIEGSCRRRAKFLPDCIAS